MTESMLEKLVRALDPDFDRIGPEAREGVGREVRAVLLALREPDEGMEKAYEDVWFSGEDFTKAFAAAIDFILSEPNPST